MRFGSITLENEKEKEEEKEKTKTELGLVAHSFTGLQKHLGG